MRIATLIFAAAVSSPALLAQVPETFEVASIKISVLDGSGTSFAPQPGGGLRVGSASLRSLIKFAYDLRDFQLSGTAGWMNTERYDVLAKGGGVGPGPQDYKSMNDAQRTAMFALIRKRLQALLQERFQLTVHRETKELPMYSLVVGKNGVKMQSTDPSITSGTSMISEKIFKAQRASVDFIAQGLAGVLGRPVKDETGLKGFYDFKMEWTPEPSAGPNAEEGRAPEPLGPSLFTALQEQLGLKLEGRKGPMEVIVVDRGEKPSEN